MKCAFCGKQLKSAWKVCPNCGKKLDCKTLLPDVPFPEEFIAFGSWPQTKKAGNVSVGAAGEDGYFTGSDGCKYAAAGGCYFKVEPITWQVLKKSNSGALLLCRDILAAAQYDLNANNYVSSLIRGKLNSSFLQRAFTLNEQEKIIKSAVDNGKGGNTANNLTSFDKVFLPGKAEIFDDFGFIREDKQKKVTGYAAATGVEAYGGNGFWWLRDPDFYDADAAYAINPYGVLESCTVHFNNIGVAPCIRINFN